MPKRSSHLPALGLLFVRVSKRHERTRPYLEADAFYDGGSTLPLNYFLNDEDLSPAIVARVGLAGWEKGSLGMFFT